MQSQEDNSHIPVDQFISLLKPIAERMLVELSKSSDKEAIKARIEAFLIFKKLNAKLEELLDKEMKPVFHDLAKEVGEENEKGGMEINLDGHCLLREKRVDTLPNEEKLRALLKTHDLDVMSCFDISSAVTLNPSKLQLLIDTGKLDEDDVKALHDVSWAIKATPNKTLKEKLDSVFKKPKKKSPGKSERTRQ